MRLETSHIIVILSMCSLQVKTVDSSFKESRGVTLLERPIVGKMLNQPNTR